MNSNSVSHTVLLPGDTKSAGVGRVSGSVIHEEDLQDTADSWAYDLLQSKNAKQNQQRENAHRAKSRGNQV